MLAYSNSQDLESHNDWKGELPGRQAIVRTGCSQIAGKTVKISEVKHVVHVSFDSGMTRSKNIIVQGTVLLTLSGIRWRSPTQHHTLTTLMYTKDIETNLSSSVSKMNTFKGIAMNAFSYGAALK